MSWLRQAQPPECLLPKLGESPLPEPVEGSVARACRGLWLRQAQPPEALLLMPVEGPLPELVEGNDLAYNFSMPFLYILECEDGTYYTGSTWNLDERIYQHHTGNGAKYTNKHKPEKLVYIEEYPRIDEAYARERQIHGWSHRKKKALIEGNFENLVKFSKNYSQFGKPDDRE